MPAITPFLWFDNNLEEALNFYSTIFNNSKMGEVKKSTSDGPFGPIVLHHLKLRDKNSWQ